MINEETILSRIQMLQEIEPSTQAVERAMNRVRQNLRDIERARLGLTANIHLMVTKNRITKFVAAAAVIIFVIVPISYGAYKLIKYIFREETKQSFRYDDHTYTHDREIISPIYGIDEANAKKQLEEARKLFREGKAVQIGPNLYEITLSDGTKIKCNLFKN